MKQPLTGTANLPPSAKGIADGKCSMDPKEKSLWETPSSDFWTRAVEARMKKTVQDEDKHNKLRKSQHAFPRGMSCLTNLLKHSEGVSMDKSDIGNTGHLGFAEVLSKVSQLKLLQELGCCTTRGFNNCIED